MKIKNIQCNESRTMFFVKDFNISLDEAQDMMNRYVLKFCATILDGIYAHKFILIETIELE